MKKLKSLTRSLRSNHAYFIACSLRVLLPQRKHAVMTCIVAVVDQGAIHMACDSIGVDGYSMQVRADEKAFTNGEFIFGVCGSFRLNQILRYDFSPPTCGALNDDQVHRFMVTEFVKEMRKCLNDAGYMRKEDNLEEFGDDSAFLVGLRGRLFQISEDMQVGESTHSYDSVGCGADIALGAMFASVNMPPKERLLLALKVSETFNAGVRGPFQVTTLKPKILEMQKRKPRKSKPR